MSRDRVAGRLVVLVVVGALGLVGCGRSELALEASGATFPQPFYEAVIDRFHETQDDIIVNYAGGGSGNGRQDFRDGVVDFAGTDGLVDEDSLPEYPPFHYVPTVAGPITVSFNLEGVDRLRLTAEVIAAVFQGGIGTWDDERIAELNPDAELPSQQIAVMRRSDGSGTTEQFTRYLQDAAGNWELGSGSTVPWPGITRAGRGNGGVAQLVDSTPGAIGYVDYSVASELGLRMAAVENAEGEFIEPGPDAVIAALNAIQIADDLSYEATNAPGAGSYPIAAPTWILVRARMEDPERAEAVRRFMRFMLTEGQDLAPEIGYAPLPDSLRERALGQIERIRA